MSGPPDMNEKLRTRIQNGVAPMMEPDETVLYAVPNQGIPVFVFLLAAIFGVLPLLALLPYLIQKSSVAVLTDRNVYVFKTNGFGFKARNVLLKAPRGGIDAQYAGSAFPGRYLMVGDQKLWLALNKKIHARARAIAESASGQPALDQAAAAAAAATAAQESPPPAPPPA
jgi:hypothetical protein